jgi:hypothetical protein
MGVARVWSFKWLAWIAFLDEHELFPSILSLAIVASKKANDLIGMLVRMNIHDDHRI